MKDLLLLVHRIPFPPNKGDKIRSYHLLKHLAKQYRIHLCAFIDDPDDWQYVDNVKAYCVDTFFLGLKPLTAKIRSLTGLFKGEPLTLPYYANHKMDEWVSRKLSQETIDSVIVYSSSMAQYVVGRMPEDTTCVVDFVDVDSDKWRQYAERQSFPGSWVYRREAQKLLGYEESVARQVDASVFVSKAEADVFSSLISSPGAKVDYYGNGVDVDYFSPDHQFDSPFKKARPTLVFTGAMDYWANVDAVVWMANKVFPQLKASYPELDFVIVGTRPTEAVQELGKIDGVTVTGRVADVRPYLAHASLSIAPLRIARGIQNKVLEAMAMGCAVVASPAACEGIDATAGRDFILAESVTDWVSVIENHLDAPEKVQSMKMVARQRILEGYTWDSHLARLDALIDPPECEEESSGFPEKIANNV